jgi:diguanylate cyclase (GGDEF)-like protein
MAVSIASRPVVAHGQPSGVVITFRDVTAQRTYRKSLELVNEALEQQASTDPVKGVFNRLKLSQLLKIEIDRARRYQSRLCVVLLDIDRFKNINDTYGHLQGDAVLRELGDLLSGGMRSTDILARWGGEEFMVVAPGCDLERAVQFAEKLRSLVAAHRFSIPLQVTSSFGVAELKADDTEVTLTSRADRAL